MCWLKHSKHLSLTLHLGERIKKPGLWHRVGKLIKGLSLTLLIKLMMCSNLVIISFSSFCSYELSVIEFLFLGGAYQEQLNIWTLRVNNHNTSRYVSNLISWQLGSCDQWIHCFITLSPSVLCFCLSLPLRLDANCFLSIVWNHYKPKANWRFS